MAQSPLDLSGIFPPIPTPFDSAGALAFDRLRENLARWEGEPLAGYVVGGSNGEFPLLSPEERIEVVRRARQSSAIQQKHTKPLQELR